MTSATFDDNLSELPIAKSNALIYGVIVSIVFHSLVIYFYYDAALTFSVNLPQKNKSNSKTFEIQLTQQRETSQQDSTDKLSKTKQPEKEHAQSEQPRSEKTRSEKPRTEQPNTVQKKAEINNIGLSSKENRNILINDQPLDLPPTENQMINLNAFREAIGESEIQASFNHNNQTQSKRFNPLIEKHLQEQEKAEEKRKALQEIQQRRKDNEYYKFKIVGDTQTVRVDGVCFDTPIKKDMEIETRVWTYIGECEIKEKLDFTRRKLDIEYQEGKSDF